MKKNKFDTIGISGKAKTDASKKTITALLDFLQEKKKKIFLDNIITKLIANKDNLPTVDNLAEEKLDLVIVVGGDGSMLYSSRQIIDTNVPVIGINRGGLGFLTDINPNDVKTSLEQIFSGEYTQEQRFLLKAEVKRGNEIIGNSLALNDCVLYSGDVARLIEFEVYVDDEFVYKQRADGLITATPTGSTAYALSGGGPILHPTLGAIVLVPMFPHTLTARPIVLKNTSKIKLVVSAESDIYPMIACDGQVHLSLAPNDEINIEQYQNELTLIHPKDYNYFAMLRGKLGWGTKFKNDSYAN